MKKFVTQAVSVLLLLVLCVGAISCSNTSDTPDGMTDVAAADATYRFYVPEGWVPHSENGVSAARYGSTDRSNVSMMLYLPELVMTPEYYWENLAKPDYEKDLSSFTVLEEGGEVKLGGRDGKKYVFTGMRGSTAYKFMQAIVTTGDWVYIFTYTATPDKYDLHLEDVDRILTEFRY